MKPGEDPSATTIAIRLDSLESTQHFAETLATCLPLHMVICLEGTLGAGKTTWSQFFAQALGVAKTEVTSPTFVIIHRYEGSRIIHHIDAYRVQDLDEFLELGVEEIFESSGVTLIEWADRVHDVLPSDRIVIQLEWLGEFERSALLTSTGPRSRETLQQFQRRWQSIP